MVFPICHQASSISQMSSSLRWFIYIIGLTETGLWSGTIFGWASIVHLLKIRGVYSNLCSNTTHDGSNTTDPSTALDYSTLPIGGSTSYPVSTTEVSPLFPSTDWEPVRCAAQDEQFVLVGTVTIVIYALPGILIGYCLHHLGLAFTRVVSCLMISVGFLLLSITTIENPDYLWGGSILLSIGGNTIRMSCLQFGNLFPNHRNTFLAILSGFYTVSAAMFMLVQVASEAGYQWESLCQMLSAASLLIIVLTPLMPLYHIPYVDTDEETRPLLNGTSKGEYNEDEDLDRPLRESLLSWSSLFHTYWLFSVLFATSIFGTYFNAWINSFSKSREEVAFYSRLYGYANLLCGFVAPIPGLLTDVITKSLRRGTRGINSKIATVQAMIAPIIMVTINVTMQLSCFFFFSSYAVYVGLIYLIINRPSCMGVGLPFLRARFPVTHFNRLIGIQGTVLCLLTIIQYPYFAWTMKQYFAAYGTLVGFIILALVNPLHLSSKRYLHRVLSPYKTQMHKVLSPYSTQNS